jgi:hypothetical protein
LKVLERGFFFALIFFLSLFLVFNFPAPFLKVVAKVADLKARYDLSVGQKNSLRAEAADLEEKLDRADKLIGDACLD